jgi:hypothetical protein
MREFLGRSLYGFSRRGFAAAELIVVLAVVGMASLLVGGLFQQVSKLGQKSSQAGAILEVRNKITAIVKNSDAWTNQMRSKIPLYASCIPDEASITAGAQVFSCPDVSGSGDIRQNDPKMNDLVSSQYHIVSAPAVDIMGDLIAGSSTEPLYLDLSGKACSGNNAATNCFFKSTGYFMRTNSALNENPGNVLFVIKVERNLLSLNVANNGVFKPEYLIIELGQSWMRSNVKNPPGTLRVGYLLDGSPRFVNPTHTCPNGEVYVGAGSSGAALCKALPSCGPGELGVYLGAGSSFGCAMSSACSAGEVHLGFASGTGAAICNASGVSCGAGQIQVGVAKVGSTSQAQCVAMPTCEATKILTYTGSVFQCVSSAQLASCGANEYMEGLDPTGNPICKEINRKLAGTNLTCGAGEYVAGLDAEGNVDCKPLAGAAGIKKECTASEELFGVNEDGSVKCRLRAGGSSSSTKISVMNQLISESSAGYYAHMFSTTEYRVLPGTEIDIAADKKINIRALLSVATTYNTSRYRVKLVFTGQTHNYPTVVWLLAPTTSSSSDYPVGKIVQDIRTWNFNSLVDVPATTISANEYGALNLDASFHTKTSGTLSIKIAIVNPTQSTYDMTHIRVQPGSYFSLKEFDN